MKHFINLKDIPAKDLRKIIVDAKKRGMKVGVYPIGENTWTDVGQWGEYQKAVDHFKT